MKRWHYISIISIISMVVTTGLLGAGALVVRQSRVPSEAIASSVTRTPALIARAWHLPAAATFHGYVNRQSNGSRCGPAAVANAYRSLGEAASTEGKVLAGTGRCWTGVCILGLTLDELAESPGPTRAGKSRSCVISARTSFWSICVAPTIRADATS